MKCPLCSVDMKLHKKDISYDEAEKEYDRSLFVCEKDDVWVSVEIPRRNLA